MFPGDDQPVIWSLGLVACDFGSLDSTRNKKTSRVGNKKKIMNPLLWDELVRLLETFWYLEQNKQSQKRITFWLLKTLESIRF